MFHELSALGSWNPESSFDFIKCLYYFIQLMWINQHTVCLQILGVLDHPIGILMLFHHS